MAVACAGAWGIGGAGGLFTEAELAAADQLVQLSGSSSGSGSAGGDEAAASESPRSVNTCAGAAAWEEAVPGPGLGMVELDRRARKRYRLLTELYAATRPVDGAGDARKRKRRSHEPEAETTMRYGDRCF